MPRHWHHGHSLGAGVIVGVGLASFRVWTLLTLAFLAGGLVAFAIVAARRLVFLLRSRRRIYR